MSNSIRGIFDRLVTAFAVESALDGKARLERRAYKIFQRLAVKLRLAHAAQGILHGGKHARTRIGKRAVKIKIA